MIRNCERSIYTQRILRFSKRYSSTRIGLTEQIQYSQKQLKRLYARTGFIADTESSFPIIKRFLRQPFSDARYKICVVSLGDGDLFRFPRPDRSFWSTHIRHFRLNLSRTSLIPDFEGRLTRSPNDGSRWNLAPVSRADFVWGAL